MARDAAKQLALVTELARNYADGLLSAGTAMDAIAAALLSDPQPQPAADPADQITCTVQTCPGYGTAHPPLGSHLGELQAHGEENPR